MGGVFSVGPVYFILMLFAVRAIYILVDAFVQEKVYKFLLVIMLSFIGIKLGQAGYWLPWSLDVALYVLIFYQLGIYFRKYKLLTMVKRCPMCYFLLSPIWAYMIYRGSMEIAVRNYGNYGLVVIGSVSGTLLLYKYADYIVKAFPITSTVLAFIGRITVIVLIIHTLAGGLIGNLVSNKFDSNYMPYMVLSITTQIMLSVIIKFLSDFVRLRIKGFRWPYDMRGMV